MNDEFRFILQLVVNILGAGFVTIVGFSQVGDFLIDKKPRHVAAALAWFSLLPVLILRTAAVVKPPLLDPQNIVDGAAIGWALCLFFGLTWGILRLHEKGRERRARRKLGLDVDTENEL